MAISISPGGTLGGYAGPSGGASGGGVTVPGANPSGGLPSSSSQNQSTNQSTGSQYSNSYIPEYSQTPILNEIAQYARSMAPQVYQWGMDQYNKNQGNIDTLMRSAMTYASPQRVATEMGRAEAEVMQGAEAGRENAIKDLQSYGIDPSSGRYQALDNASRVMAGAAAAGAGNVQREATMAQGANMQNQAIGLGMQNTQLGYGAAGAMNALLGTGMQLKYSPLGTQSAGVQQSSGQSAGSSESWTYPNAGSGGGGSGGSGGIPAWHNTAKQIGSRAGMQAAEGGDVPEQLSPSDGAAVDDVQANLTAGEFVIPKDVAEWKGQEFFYKLMAQARKLRATAGQEDSGMGYQQDAAMQEPAGVPGYARGGQVDPDFWLDPRLYGTRLRGSPGKQA